MNPPRVRLFGIQIDPLRMPQAVSRLREWIARDRSGPCRFVVTPNVDHLALLDQHESLRLAYADADLVLADGMPLVVASRWFGKPLPERVTGADLVPSLLADAGSDRPMSVFLLGAAPGVGRRAADRIERLWPSVRVVDTYSPPVGFENDQQENEKILRRIAAVQPDVLVIGLGAPKQELWIHRHRDRVEAKVALCVGATIDFLAGEKRRAPRWMQNWGLEWLHRLSGEPRRLFRRYLRDALLLPRMAWREWKTG